METQPGAGHGNLPGEGPIPPHPATTLPQHENCIIRGPFRKLEENSSQPEKPLDFPYSAQIPMR
jgi:hypothetical protein